MKATTLTLRDAPNQRLDLSRLTPQGLAGLNEAEIAVIPINTGKDRVLAGDVFRIVAGNGDEVRIASANGARFDYVGKALSGGRLFVEGGGVGAYAGLGMTGGTLHIVGDTGPFTGSGMSGGFIRIQGNAGDHLGGARPGEMTGMGGGTIIVTGRAGARCGDRMRRGLIAIGSDAGDYAGSRMIAGTIAIFGNCGALPGFLMRRGTIVLGGEAAAWPPTFVESGKGELTYLRLLAGALKNELPPQQLASLKPAVRRLAGDMAALGKGEILRLQG